MIPHISVTISNVQEIIENCGQYSVNLVWEMEQEMCEMLQYATYRM